MSDESEEEFNDSPEEQEEPHSASDDDDDDDKPIASLKKKGNKDQRPSPRRARASISYNEDDESEDDEDDIPLADLVKSKDKQKSPASNGRKKATAEHSNKKKTKTSLAPAPVKSSARSVSSDKKFEFASTALYGTECQKGLLIQRLLCRWWYAIDWPAQPTNGIKVPPDYEPLDGFAGVYVCTSSANAGHILDTRNMKEAPSFRNFAAKPAAELQTLLLSALEEQKRQLVQAEGPDTRTERDIDVMLKWAKKLNPDKADTEAAKVLKANKITL